MDDPATGVVSSRRLDLVPLPAEFLGAVLEGRRADAAALLDAAVPEGWPGDDRWLVEIRLDDLTKHPEMQPWLLRAMVLREPERKVIGHIGFHWAPSDDGPAEIGYAVLPEFRRSGYATEAVEAMLAWAEREHKIARFRASVAPDNAPSLQLVRKLGFQQIGSQIDERDGLELVFELRRAGRARPEDPGLRR